MLFGEDRDQLNLEHAENPTAGDYWSEHLVGILIVLDVNKNENKIVTCETRKEIGRDHWTWDLSKIKSYTFSEFKEKLSYNTCSLKDKFWADVMVGNTLNLSFAETYAKNKYQLSDDEFNKLSKPLNLQSELPLELPMH